jgi:hypothetical protein
MWAVRRCERSFSETGKTAPHSDSLLIQPPTKELLSDWLRQSGSLPRGEVSEVTVDRTLKTEISTLTFITVAYSSATPGDLPSALVVKSPHAPNRDGAGVSGEDAFYRRLASAVGSPPSVRCLAALAQNETRNEILVLQDLRATHEHPPWPLPPSRHDCELAVAALAKLHARFFQVPELGHAVGRLHTEDSLTSMVQGIAAHVPAFWDSVGGALTGDARTVYDRVFGSALRPWLRLTDPAALTVVHGDAHTWNFLFPRSGEGEAYLIDWQLWHLDVGARDLAFMMALHWYPRRRRELERPLLELYHSALVGCGVVDYTFDDLWLDYRRCVVRNLTIPVIWWSRGMKPEGWWHRFECALAAYQDLDCEDLL